MLRNRVVTALQKTYDDCYLSCSTAVFYEGQGNEAEAMRYWKSAFERISQHHTRQHHTRQLASTERSPNDEVEMALRKSLKELELQSRERIDLLETLKVSRQHDYGSLGKTKSPDSTNIATGRPSGSKSIGQGTVPAMRYSDLSRPFCSAQQSFSPRRTSENVMTNVDGPSTDIAVGTRSPSPLNALKLGKTPRPPSPERHSMRTTLRSGRIIDRSDKNTPLSPRLNGEGPSKAATLAWNTFELRDAVRQPSLQNSSSSATLTAHQHTEPLLKIGPSSTQWDSHSRRLVSPSQTRSPSKLMKTPIASQRFSEYSSPQSSSAASNAPGISSNSELMNLEKSSTDQSSASHTVLTYSASPRPRRVNLTATSWASSTSRLSEKQNGSSPPFPEAGIGHPNPLPFPRHHVDRQGQSRFEEYSDLRPLSTSEASITVDDEDTTRGYIKNNLRIARTDSIEGTKRNASPRGNLSAASWARIKMQLLKNLPPGVDESAAQQILNDIVVQGDEVHWGDIAGLEIAKSALREAVVYPFLRPDLFMGLREPARGMLLFGPPGTGKTMLARAVATESRSSFFSISASSLTSKYLGESEKLVKALFSLARALSPSIIFVDEIDSLLSQRSGSGENEATRRIKTEFLIQWSDLQRAAAGKEMTDKDKQRGDANRVLVLAATNMPWAIDEAARRRFVRRQYIPLPEPATREIQLKTLLGQQKHNLTGADIDRLVHLTDGFSGSDMTALAKDAAMGPLRSLGEAVLHMTTDDIRPMEFADFEASLGTIRASVSKVGLERYEEWAREFGERGG